MVQEVTRVAFLNGENGFPAPPLPAYLSWSVLKPALKSNYSLNQKRLSHFRNFLTRVTSFRLPSAHDARPAAREYRACIRVPIVLPRKILLKLWSDVVRREGRAFATLAPRLG